MAAHSADSASSMQEFHVVVPENVKPGQAFCARIGKDGPLMQVTCPKSSGPGTTLLVRLPQVELRASSGGCARAPSLPTLHANDEQRHTAGEHGSPSHTNDRGSSSEWAACSSGGRSGAGGVQTDGTAAAAQEPSSGTARPDDKTGGADGGSRRTSGRARSAISYDENKWRIRHGPSADSITVRHDVDVPAGVGHTSMAADRRTDARSAPAPAPPAARRAPATEALDEQQQNARVKSLSAPTSSSDLAPAPRGPRAGVEFDDIPPAVPNGRPLVSSPPLSLLPYLYPTSTLCLNPAIGVLRAVACVYLCGCIDDVGWRQEGGNEREMGAYVAPLVLIAHARIRRCPSTCTCAPFAPCAPVVPCYYFGAPNVCAFAARREHDAAGRGGELAQITPADSVCRQPTLTRSSLPRALWCVGCGSRDRAAHKQRRAVCRHPSLALVSANASMPLPARPPAAACPLPVTARSCRHCLLAACDFQSMVVR